MPNDTSKLVLPLALVAIAVLIGLVFRTWFVVAPLLIVFCAYVTYRSLFQASPGDDDDRLVTLATFRFPVKAEAAQYFLEQCGIQTFLADANLVTADWFLGNAVGNVKLQIPQRQAEAALEILRDHPRLLDARISEDSKDQSDEMHCLACGELLEDNAHTCAACGWSYRHETGPA